MNREKEEALKNLIKGLIPSCKTYSLDQLEELDQKLGEVLTMADSKH